jgi:phosphoglycolate phosphatase-like HAD superfamily hydrolase
MLLDLLRVFGVPASAALFVGDAECDRAAAEAAGMPFRWARHFFGRG